MRRFPPRATYFFIPRGKYWKQGKDRKYRDAVSSELQKGNPGSGFLRRFIFAP